MVYARECLDREAAELAQRIDLFTLPVESFGGGKQPIRKRLVDIVNILCDAPAGTATVDEEQQRAEAEYSKQVVAAIEAGDDALAAELERNWNRYCEQRKAKLQEEALAQNTNVFEGDVSLLYKARAAGF